MNASKIIRGERRMTFEKAIQWMWIVIGTMGMIKFIFG